MGLLIVILSVIGGFLTGGLIGRFLGTNDKVGFYYSFFSYFIFVLLSMLGGIMIGSGL